MASIFTKIQDEAERKGIVPYTAKSKNWFYNRLKKITNVTPATIIRDEATIQRSRPLLGRMFMFVYDPKTKETLPYYDTFPLILMVGPAERGFYGLNLHYLHPRARALFFDRISSYLNNDAMDETTRFRMTYDMLNSSRRLRAYAPCFKRYLKSNIRSTIVEIPPTEWEIALFLPTERFVGDSKNKIWNRSKGLI